jgi:hypothetical protein
MAPWDELVLACRLKSDVPQEVVETLQFMMGESTDGPFITPDHPFFVEGPYGSEWRVFFGQGTLYFSGKQYASLEPQLNDHYALTIRTHVRLGSEVIKQFLEWLAPFIDHTEDFLGYTICDETTNHVELIYLEGGDIYYYSTQLWNNPPDIKKVKITDN